MKTILLQENAVNGVTQALNAVELSDPKAADELLPLVYQELRRLAAHRMANEAPGQTLQPTALVHEAWLKLAGQNNPRFESRAHFFAAAAEAMRRILIDNVRRKRALRHGGGLERVALEDADPTIIAKDDEWVAVADALEKLSAEHKPMAELVKLRFFAGLTNKEAAAILGVSEPTTERWWAFARAWLYREIRATAQR